VNLLANALKFTEPGGQVLVWMRGSGDHLLVGVRDNGRGISPEAQRWVFERFRQADDEVARRYGGTGIGLALAKELVELHGGHITLESEEGKGSDFVVHLRFGSGHFAPGTVEQSMSSAQATHCNAIDKPTEWSCHLAERRCYRFISLSDATESAPTPLNSKLGYAGSRVLVVEDNVEVQRHLSMQLGDCHSLVLATDGERGLEVARSEHPDVIITDCMMPKMDGVTLLRELKADAATADIPVIMLSANNLESNRTAARNAGADIYLCKPFSAQELRSAVNQLLRNRVRQVGVVVREQVKSLEVISAGIAHEIHNPLSYLSNAVHVIQQKLDELHAAANQPGISIDELRANVLSARERTVRMISVALTGIKRIQAVVTLVRGYARAGSPRDFTALSLDELVREVSRLVMTPDGRDVQIVSELGTEGIRVRGIPGELEQVIRNLLQNAIEAVPSGGHVWLRTHCDKQWVVLEVKDDGPGMPQDVKSRIFTPFFTTKEPGRGMGLGLAISHQLVANIGGDISVESMVNHGTTFRVHLPICHDQPPNVQ
ncbi:MAG TPA: ATP-binding protein, partial [Polyangiaceae bacterium]|nr:ATP-binding protein [Polyangiaceae bacterium]